MEETIAEALERFSRVWPRVQAAEPPLLPPPRGAEEAERLRRLIAGEAERRRALRCLAGTMKGLAASKLAALAAGSGERLREMQTEHFLLTGDTWPVGPRPCEGGGALTLLRRLYLAEERAGEDYARAGTETRRPELRELYEGFAAGTPRRLATLRELLAAVM